MDLAIATAGRRLIDALIDAPVAWRSPGELAGRLGWTLDRTLDEIADLDARGWLVAWDLVDGPVVTLSVAATAHCGVRLVEVGHQETPRWARAGDPDPPAVPASGVFRGQLMAALDLVADGRPGVEQAAILAEEARAQAPPRDEAGPAAARLDRLPRPTLLIGSGLSPWPGPGHADGAACPACRSARLPERAYCLWCDRWGLDELVAEARAVPARPRRPAARAHTPKQEAERQQAERRRRRARRKERRSGQAQRMRPAAARDEPFWLGTIAM